MAFGTPTAMTLRMSVMVLVTLNCYNLCGCPLTCELLVGTTVLFTPYLSAWHNALGTASMQNMGEEGMNQ